MVDVNSLQEQIIANPDYIICVLEELGHTHIIDRGRYVQCPNLDGDNNSAISVLKASLHYQNYTRMASGNLFTLVMDERGISFPQALEWVAQKCHIKAGVFEKQEITLPFGGFYKKISQNKIRPELCLNTYKYSDLPQKGNYSYKFFKDGISFDVQDKYGIRFSCDDNAILIPITDCYGNLVGCKARNNSDEDYSRRWYAYLPYSKTSVVYGWDINYRTIAAHDTAIIMESEKSCLQCLSFNCGLGLGIAGHNISDAQARLIKGLNVKKIIVAFDEGISADECEYNAKKLVSNNIIMKNKVGFIYDKDNDILKKNSKDSPSDHGKHIFEKLVKDKTIWIA